MSALQKISNPATTTITKSDKRLEQKFKDRRSAELVIALAGPIGCGISSVADALHEKLKERGYLDVVRIKLSEFLEGAIKENLLQIPDKDTTKSDRYNRYRQLQEAGKQLRKKTSNPAVLAEFAAKKISVDRLSRNGEQELSNSPIVPNKVAYIIDQVKRPEEVTLLRALYRNLFYVAGVTRIFSKREAALLSESIRKNEVDELMEIDRMEDSLDGQQLDKTLFLADYFIRNDSMAADDKQDKLNRFLSLIHGDQSVTPTEIESGMFAAYSASLRSACLSRQVGAAITAKSGEVIATGCNDVPKAGGGLYSHASGKGDMRCIHQEGRLCFNDLHKRKLQAAVGSIIDRVLGEELKDFGKDGEPIKLPSVKKDKLLDAIYKETRIKDLIEYSRSVHAEMDAIVSLARVGGAGLQDATLYTTTFPCHNCARHIVASGIMKVFYVEPYEKSLAKDLHEDAIAFEIEESKETKPRRVEFLHFEGVAPRQFHSMFRAVGRKNDEGKFIPIRHQEAHKAVPEYLDGYQDFEIKAVEHLEEELATLRENTVKILSAEGGQMAKIGLLP